MSSDNKPLFQASNDVESLTLTLQQIAASAQTNTEQFESQKKQFFEQFSQLFGSLNSSKQKKLNINTGNDNSKSTTPNMLSPSMDSPNITTRTNNTNTPKSTTPNSSIPNFKPLITKQNSFSAQSDSNNTATSNGNNNASVSNPNPINHNINNNINNNILSHPTALLNKVATANTPLTRAINTLNLTPITAIPQTQAQQAITTPTRTNTRANPYIFSPQQNLLLPQFQSVPMSIISNTSQSHSTVYQYPYITSDPNQILSSTPNTMMNGVNTVPVHNIIVPNLANTIKSSNLNINNLSFTPTNTIKSQSVVTPININKPNLMASYSNTSSQVHTPNTNANTNNVTAYESYWMRRILSNILLLFFRYHPNGVLECELCQFYQQMFNEQLVLTMDLKYLLCVHKSILITNTKERGQLYTLADDQISLFLQEFDKSILQQWIIKHIRRLFRCFPNGIACNCLHDLLYNMVEFKLQDIIPNGKWHEFVCNIPTMYCCNINGMNIFIAIDLNEINKIYNKMNNIMNNNVINANNIQYFLSHHLNCKNILRRPVGYCELLIVLLSNYYTTDINNPYYKGIDGETLEKAFHHQYQSRLVHEAPFIQDVLRKICNINIINTQNTQTKLYKLVKSSKQYFDTQPDAFAPILHRSLELINNNHIVAATCTQHAPVRANQPTQETNVPQSPFKEDHVSVFMGGFSHGTTVEDLRNELAKKGVTMISSSGISYRNYGWSFVTLSNDKEAQYLISISPIQIMGRNIDIRPFINRQRVRNHIGNKPSDKIMLHAMIELLQNQQHNDGLTVADIQSKLFRKFSYRIDGPQLTKIVGDNPKYLYIKREKTERIYLTPKLSINTSMDELKNKISKLWKHIQCNYRGNIYNIEQTDKDETDEQKEGDKIENKCQEVDENKEDTATIKSVLSNSSTKSSKSSGQRSRRRGGKNRHKCNTIASQSPGSQNSDANVCIPAINITNTRTIMDDYTICVNDFENEFARRYRFAVHPNHFGFDGMQELLDSLDVPFKVIIYEHENEDENEENVNHYTKTKPYTTISATDNNNNKFNKNNLNINITSPNITNTNTNITSPRYINSPSNYSNYSNHSYSGHRVNNNNNNNNNNTNNNYAGFVPYNSNTTPTDAATVPRMVYSNSNSNSNSNNSNTTPMSQQIISPHVATMAVQNATQANTFPSTAQLLQYQQYAMQQQLTPNKMTMTMPYGINTGGNSVSNYSIIPSVPNSIMTGTSNGHINSQPNANSNGNINLNTINMNINMTHNLKSPYHLNMSNMSNMQNLNRINVNNNNNNSTTK